MALTRTAVSRTSNVTDLKCEYTFTLPFPISDNQLYFNAYGKGRIKSTKYQRWIKEAALKIATTDLPVFSKKVFWTFDGVLMVKRNRFLKLDSHGHFKGIMDIVAKHINVDDRYAIESKFSKQPIYEGESFVKCKISFYPIESVLSS